MAKTESLNTALTDEMKNFVSGQSGNGTLYEKPSKYVHGLIRHDRNRLDTAPLRTAIINLIKGGQCASPLKVM